MKTICGQCKLFYNKQDGARTGVWYNQFCKAPSVRKEMVVDPVSGKAGYASKNDLGTVIYDDNPYPFARTINHGNCGHFEKGVSGNNSLADRALRNPKKSLLRKLRFFG